jgi:hypothetical protein
MCLSINWSSSKIYFHASTIFQLVVAEDFSQFRKNASWQQAKQNAKVKLSTCCTEKKSMSLEMLGTEE